MVRTGCGRQDADRAATRWPRVGDGRTTISTHSAVERHLDGVTDRSADRTSDRAAGTRRALLGAAREVFGRAGFTDASIADVVARAGASVGSLYHHFGGKADLYLALFEDYQLRQENRAATAVTRTRGMGETDPVLLFVAGARAYLRGCWEERDLARLFLAGGGPQGFDLVARRRNRDWVRQNARLLRAEDDPLGDALVLVLTTTIGEAGHEVSLCDSTEAAEQLGEDVLTLVARIGGPAA